MACSSPLHSYWRTDEFGDKFSVFANDFKRPFVLKDGHIYSEKKLLPCGYCLSCRLKYSSEWATRCMLEASQWSCNYFVTLTYNEYFVPRSKSYDINKFTGEVFEKESLSIRYKDVQDFLKRLRTNLERRYGHTGVRVYGGSEYGPSTQRPHYHMILFNCPIPDLKYECSNFRGEPYFSSEFLNDCWSYLDKKTGIRASMGFVTVGECTYDSAAYCARYMLKKRKGKDFEYYAEHNIEPEGSFMSRKPGIARDYFDKNSEKIYKYDQIIITGSDGKAKRVRPPRYYDNLYDIFSTEDFERVKKRRISLSDLSIKRIEERTDLDYEDYLKVSERALASRISSLSREL